ncbi:MAG: TonB-dependent receptor plug domain-containing protein [Porticoccaceae bacterium]
MKSLLIYIYQASRTVLALLPLCAVAPSYAQDVIEEITVTASHYPLASNQAAAAVSVIDQYTIENRAALSVVDLLRDVPGMAVSQSGVLGSMSDIRVRGAEANQLLVLIDGVEANDPSQDDGLNWGTLSAADIERIEVIRGSQSALYGSDAMAGVVNIITRSNKSPVSAGFVVERGGNATWQHGLNVGFASEQVALRLAANKLDSEGENIAREGSERDGHDNTTLSLKGSWRPSEQWRANFSARNSSGSSEFDKNDSATGLIVDAPSFSDFDNSHYGLSVDYENKNGLSQRVKWTIADSQNSNYPSASYDGSTAAEKQQWQYFLSYQSQTGRATLLLERETEEFERRGVVTEFWGSILDPNQDRERETDSVGLELRKTFFDQLTLAASGRVDDNSEFDDGGSERFEVSYQLNDQWRLRSSYSTAEKNPTFSERYGFYSNFVGNPDLQPESSATSELGLDWQSPDNRVSVDLTVFDSALEDEINGFVYNSDLGGFSSANKEGESQRRGAELGWSWQLNELLALDGSYSYIDSTEEAAEGERDELRRPNHIASLSLDWQISETLQSSINLQHSGTQIDQHFYASGSRYVELDAFTLVSINVNYRATDELVVYAKATNAANVNYEEVFGFSTPSRQIAVGVRYQWAD